ncbi:MAG: clan AA aspartic protease [Microcystis sp.]|jgi:clan AA aspartic protease|uniref:Clan AA aspartic protease n=1 Tax=Microcystis flos-aquae Mf_QC_C_20070823_S10D TaxID=2486236 RepID=A0A552KP75_9CHRO|nr:MULTISPECIES: clan AA aspartic protease [unclassified Microcystis]MCA2818700.1 clan AA aspartic protease [Microcystis sp. M085S1]MCA2854941.1 clan AA aspartic protease [Microcystis sp. M065S1]MCZ8054388.1 clan AA aspartic protease [Microcystis sp. LE19-12.2C]MDJ0548028.1 clan AA aspartic protease [Microcystis sp. M49637_WE12]TRT74472.1 MAG: clan AA aspartic protease [Microcystis flos-aquae Ma_QC_C_20070823_S18]TRU03086.1 MAG: clan AA aspartic protease [Microcystis flos-aquae Ma_QC_C_200708
MMQGIVDQNCEATIRLVVGNLDSQRQMIDAVIDTGFTGFLTLPSSVLADLNLRAYRREEGILGNGSTCIFDVYRGLVIWDGELRRIDINESDTEPLVGMGLLYGYRMQLDVIEGGTVTIQALSSLS